ncbi:unnamed protein product [Didymodactylos carnosus]|uniref:Kinesin light chain n=1 Tax=Didymodactylos carnosus TaxID=1234261 RepID=A0A813UC21_9BILA|nr:unnamed protein product [Didymodactylos carnosus]CAF1123759.1 unnamed protein product [Didymodactylos carnosus]CAF3608113.1 unnamed protein product [Didymodactylos carnosus]CAF3899863.1 unnamed protein product [Didymodactylos carnosus]
MTKMVCPTTDTTMNIEGQFVTMKPDFVHRTRSVIQGLETLRQEHTLLINSTKTKSSDDLQKNNVKHSRLKQSLELVDLGIGEARVMVELNNHLQNLESDARKLLLQVQRLSQENSWLRDELSSTEKRFQGSKSTKLELEQEIKELNESIIKLPSLPSTITIDDKDFDLNSSSRIDDSLSLQKETTDDYETSQATTMKRFGSYSDEFGMSHMNSTLHETSARFRTIHNLVIQYASAGRYEVAVPLCRQALEDIAKVHGPDHQDRAAMLNILALVYREQNKFKEALILLEEALAIREKVLGPEDPAVAATLNNLAVLYGKQDLYKDAEPLCKRALEIREKAFGRDHPVVAKQLTNLALLCLKQGKYSMVEMYYTRAIDIYSKHYGNNDPNVAKTKNNLASLYLREGKYKAAAQLYKEVLADIQLSNANQKLTQKPLAHSQTERNSLEQTTVTMMLKNLGAIYRRQGFFNHADILEACAVRAQDDPQAITNALDVIQQTRISDELHHNDSSRRNRTQPPVSGGEQRLHRSGSFQKLRASIKRGSEKLVQKLRGTSDDNSSIKRSSSMSVLNTPPPPPPPPQHPLKAKPNFNKQASVQIQNKPPIVQAQFSEGRVGSTENLH